VKTMSFQTRNQSKANQNQVEKMVSLLDMLLEDMLNDIRQDQKMNAPSLGLEMVDCVECMKSVQKIRAIEEEERDAMTWVKTGNINHFCCQRCHYSYHVYQMMQARETII